ncbi:MULTISPECIES: glycoside hydrolase family 19 protein [unclassified Pseudomonas]|uniref:glycoside hydrolase family 19 protein n=1 Tax=unclassified Pseudomonas TaxID=196821 RepID=UPI0024468DFE|nr:MULTISPECIES: glycoside hydrolase family 19 protein [unclassified Pseudomonas]MDH0300613.1 glycoside hydrolase family 19 protein [Pseudomonas sp. GD04091]MDH1984236.1 glycoside hydrolase family 19 protein [Pseudomonas sp. GD03689]
MPITEQQLLQILPNARPVAGIFVPTLNRAMARWKIDSPVRQAAFLAQVGHESGQLRRLVENLNYSAEGLAATWKSRYRSSDGKPNAKAVALARKPEAIANDAYAGRNGNSQQGDGWRYRGRGLIQLTGRDNYRAAAQALGLPLLEQPELIEQPEHAAQSAAWWWATHGLNELADAGRFSDIGSIINTGQPGRVPHGANERKALYDLAVRVLA